MYCYTAPTNTNYLQPIVREYSAQIEALRVTTVNPGGYGQMSCLLKVPDPRQPRPELAMFSRVVLTDGGGWWWIGEISDPRIGMRNDSEYLQIGALGLGSTLRDDPIGISYTNQTVQQVAQNLISTRNYVNGTFKTQRVDSDTGGLFPTNPAGTHSPVYDGNTFEEIFGELCLIASTSSNFYTWWTAAHPTHVDIAGFPQLQVWADVRDTATTTWMASVALGEVLEYEIAPSQERAYNYIEVLYNNGASGVGIKHSIDSRLNQTDFSQQTAPFPWRKLRRDVSGTSTVGPSEAQAIADAYLAQYKDPSNKVHIVLMAVRDGYGNPQPLWRLTTPGNQNIFVPEMAVRGQTLPTAPTAGVNQFYIVSAEYSESSTDDARVTLECDNFEDKASTRIARLTAAADALLRSRAISGHVRQKAGAIETGQCGVSFNASLGGLHGGQSVNFKTQMTSVPSAGQISLTQIDNVNASNPTISDITAVGFHLRVTSVASGDTIYVATYTVTSS